MYSRATKCLSCARRANNKSEVDHPCAVGIFEATENICFDHFRSDLFRQLGESGIKGICGRVPGYMLMNDMWSCLFDVGQERLHAPRACKRANAMAEHVTLAWAAVSPIIDLIPARDEIGSENGRSLLRPSEPSVCQNAYSNFMGHGRDLPALRVTVKSEGPARWVSPPEKPERN